VIGEGTTFDFINNQIIPSQFTFTRGPVNGNAWSVNMSGDWFESSANVARFDNTFPAPISARGLLLEGSRTNLNTNPRAEGSVDGTPGTGPTGWLFTATAASREIVGTTTVNGITGLLVRFFGTPTSTAVQNLRLGPADVISVGTTVSNSCFISLTAGSLTNVTGFALRNDNEAGSTVFTPSTQLQRITNIRVSTSTASSTLLRWNYADTVTPVDFTIFIGFPCREHSVFPSSPIVPPVASPATSTRATDVLTSTLSSLGLTGAYTVVATFNNPQLTSSFTYALLQIDDGTDTNRIRMRSLGGGVLVDGGTVNAGVATNTSSLGTLTAGTRYAVGLSYDGATSVTFNLNGGATQTVSGAPAGLTTLRIGDNAAATGPLFGYVIKLQIIPRALSATELQNATVAALT
jgi:hypothetical protein